MNEAKMICYCSNVTEGDIRKALANGAKDLKDIKAQTGACTLGRCAELNPSGK